MPDRFFQVFVSPRIISKFAHIKLSRSPFRNVDKILDIDLSTMQSWLGLSHINFN